LHCKTGTMVVISKAVLKEFADKYPDAVANDRYIFDIKGNQYRLIALIIFKVRTVFILFIGTHKEYDKIDASEVQFKK
jgi:mRNA-degrading endonuclease HigB of HigAB toxin-antitoxin module